MWKFFVTKKWLAWSWLVTAVILISTWYQVQLDVRINEWFGKFYDTMQRALGNPGAVSLDEFIGQLFTFANIAALWVLISIVTTYIISHWLFRWRSSMVEYYHSMWDKARHVEGASQRVQEDTVKFSRIMESLGVGILESVMTLVAFLPILHTLSAKVTELPWIGQVSNSLIWIAVLTALGGTAFLAIVGVKLPGIEYDIQKREAAYRKELVLGEEYQTSMQPATVAELFSKVRLIHFKSYAHYFYFNACKWSYLQGMVIVPYIALAPTIVAGVVTLGFVQQISRAFGKVAESLQFIVRSWSSIIELISVVKRLREFELTIKG